MSLVTDFEERVPRVKRHGRSSIPCVDLPCPNLNACRVARLLSCIKCTSRSDSPSQLTAPISMKSKWGVKPNDFAPHPETPRNFFPMTRSLQCSHHSKIGEPPMTGCVTPPGQSDLDGKVRSIGLSGRRDGGQQYGLLMNPTLNDLIFPFL